MKMIRLKDLDIIKEQKKMDKKIDIAFERKCLICNQTMKHLGNLVWYCKRCDTLTSIKHVVIVKNEKNPYLR